MNSLTAWEFPIVFGNFQLQLHTENRNHGLPLKTDPLPAIAYIVPLIGLCSVFVVDRVFQYVDRMTFSSLSSSIVS